MLIVFIYKCTSEAIGVYDKVARKLTIVCVCYRYTIIIFYSTFVCVYTDFGVENRRVSIYVCFGTLTRYFVCAYLAQFFDFFFYCTSAIFVSMILLFLHASVMMIFYNITRLSWY